MVLEVASSFAIDETSDISLEQVESGEINHWNLSVDTGEGKNLLEEEENDNSVWTIKPVSMDERPLR